MIGLYARKKGSNTKLFTILFFLLVAGVADSYAATHMAKIQNLWLDQWGVLRFSTDVAPPEYIAGNNCLSNFSYFMLGSNLLKLPFQDGSNFTDSSLWKSEGLDSAVAAEWLRCAAGWPGRCR